MFDKGFARLFECCQGTFFIIQLIFRIYGYEMLPEEKKEAKKVTTLPEGQSPKTAVKAVTDNA